MKIWHLNTLLFTLLAATGITHAAPNYRLHDLGDLDYNYYSLINVEGINNHGVIVGNAIDTAFVASIANGIQPLNLGVPTWRTWATGINDSGQISGFYYSPNDDNPSAYVWSPTSGTKTIAPATTRDGQWQTYAEAWGINNSGMVVGQYTSASSGNSAFIWSQDAGLNVLPIFGRMDTGSRGINSNGQFVIESSRSSCHCEATLVDTRHESLTATQLNSLNLTQSLGVYDINDFGASVGQSNSHAARWDANGNVIDLGTLQATDSTSIANSINNSGIVVGQSSGGTYSAFIWSGSNGMRDLNTFIDEVTNPTGIKMVDASAISDSGYIAGVGSNGHLIVLEPLASSVPEPGAGLLLLSGILVVYSVKRRKF